MTASTGHDSDGPLLHRDKVRRALRSQPRLDAVHRAGLLGAEQPIPALARAARVVACALRVPIAQMNVLTDSTSTPVAVHAEPGEDEALWRQARPVGTSYCKYVVWKEEPFVVQDSGGHRLVANSYATRELNIVAYLGAPIHAPASARSPRGARGPVIGALCVVDHVPRMWTRQEQETLTDIAGGVSELIAQRIDARDAVRAADKQTARVLAAAAIGVLATDALGVTTFANPAAQEMLGYSEGKLIGHDMHALIHHSYADGTHYFEVDCPNRRARLEGRTFRTALDTFWRSDGTPIFVEATMTPLLDRGEVIGTVLTFQDISDRPAGLAAERAARETAEAANRAKSTLLTSMAFELRTPLAAIGVLSERLEAGMIETATAAQRGDLRSIRRNQQHLLELTENVLEFAALDACAVNSRPRQ